MQLSAEKLTTFLVEKLGVDAAELTPQAALFSSSLLDSFSLVELMVYVEKQEKFRMKPTDVRLDNLDSIEKILAYVARREQRKAA